MAASASIIATAHVQSFTRGDTRLDACNSSSAKNPTGNTRQRHNRLFAMCVYTIYTTNVIDLDPPRCRQRILYIRARFLRARQRNKYTQKNHLHRPVYINTESYPYTYVKNLSGELVIVPGEALDFCAISR